MSSWLPLQITLDWGKWKYVRVRMTVNGDQQRINTVVRAKSVLATFLCQVSPFEWERLYLFEEHEISYFARISCTTVEIQRKRRHVDCRRLVDQHLPKSYCCRPSHHSRQLTGTTLVRVSSEPNNLSTPWLSCDNLCSKSSSLLRSVGLRWLLVSRSWSLQGWRWKLCKSFQEEIHTTCKRCFLQPSTTKSLSHWRSKEG